MATFAATLAADLAAIFTTDEFAETVTYKAGGTGTGSSISAIVVREGDLAQITTGAGLVGLPVARELRADFAGGGTQETAEVWVRESDVAAAAYGDTVTFGGATWTVRPAWREI
jgi:hypothetical protein